jgi:polysaccharide export outer membrane protein
MTFQFQGALSDMRQYRNEMVLFIGLVLTAAVALPQNTAAPGFTSRDVRYKIQPNDVVDIQFRLTPEFNFTATVQPDGYVSSQITGDVKIGGLNLTEASSAIAKGASTRLKDPEVGVILKDFVKPHFVVAGEVAHPGSYELRGDVGLVQAIAMSGGFVRDSAKRSQVLLVRRTSQSDMAEVKLFDMKKLMTKNNIAEDITLKPNDLLVVPQNAISKIEPYMHIAALGVYGLTAAGLP